MRAWKARPVIAVWTMLFSLMMFLRQRQRIFVSVETNTICDVTRMHCEFFLTPGMNENAALKITTKYHDEGHQLMNDA